MVSIFSDQTHSIIILKKTEEIILSIEKYVKKEHIQSAYFTMIGAVSCVTLSFYDLETKTYLDKTFNEELEIASVIGNIAYVDGKPKIHAHGTFSRKDYSVIGGHIQGLTISATGEIHLTKISKKLQRKYDEETGLYLLSED